MTEPTPKPTDALEELKFRADGIRLCNGMEEVDYPAWLAEKILPAMEAAIVAWEKERAELGRVEEKKAARLERVWAVHYGNYEPSEVESIWATEELARAHRKTLDGSMWTVSWFEVGWESASKKEDAGT